MLALLDLHRNLDGHSGYVTSWAEGWLVPIKGAVWGTPQSPHPIPQPPWAFLLTPD